MDIGVFAIITGFVATIVSLVSYFLTARNEDILNSPENSGKKQGNDFFLELGRLAYYVMVASVFVATIYLYYLIFTHQFQVKYVFQYTSRDLSLGLLVSTFWAGQEGSFLFWTFLTAAFGLYFMKTAAKYEKKSMVFLNIIMIFFLLLLIKASPFVTMGQTPADGNGLNPLLQNFWMIIHPPILFIGYAAIVFPFVMSIAALWQKDYDGWLTRALPWTVFSSLTLGAGIIIGAFWAYETLGWGGYWGWDPVENSSLIPWLTMLALIHSMLVQRRNGSLRKTNFFLAIITYVLVLYATFLTRSGVLEDFSVHSFQNLGLNNLLILFMLTVLVIGFTFFIRRITDIPNQAIDFSTLNRENGLLASVFIFAASAFLTFLGTSSPIITGILGDPSQVDISFYDKVNLPIGILMALFIGITPILLWVEKDLSSLPKKILIPVILAVVSSVVSIFFGELDTGEIIFMLAGYFALWSNVIVLYRNWKISWSNIAGPLSHFGVGMMLVGIIISGNYAQSERVILEKEKAAEVLDYQLIYKGLQPVEDGKNVLKIEVNKDNSSYMALPRLFLTKAREVMREPDVKSGFINDIYIAPLERRQGNNNPEGKKILSLLKGESAELEGFKISFTGFQMTPHEGGGDFHVGAVLQIAKDDFKHTVVPELIIGAQGQRAKPAFIPAQNPYGKEIKITMAAMNADDKRIDLIFQGFPTEGVASQSQDEQLVIEFSKKPFMSILWLGTILMIIGTTISLIQRTKAVSAR